jgi:hypothetical protein
MRFLKFRSLSSASREHTLDIIRAKSFYIAGLAELNDPFDCNCPFDMDDEEHCLYLMKEFSEINNDDALALWLVTKKEQDYKSRILAWIHDSEVRRQLYQKLLHANGVASFSRKEGVLSHPLMWAHYADSHKGICFEMESYKPLELKEVKYKDELPKINLLKLDETNVTDVFWHKGTMWSYEQEVRFIATDPSAKRLPFPANSLKAIYFGVNTDWKDIESVQDAVQAAGLNPDYGKMTPSSTANMLEVMPMPPISKFKELLQNMNPVTEEVMKSMKGLVDLTVLQYREELRKRISQK